MCESGLEKKAAHFFLTHPQVADLREQPNAVEWRDAEGRARRHTFDFLVTLRDTRRIAVAVKPKVHAERKHLQRTLALIATQIPRHFADGVLLITDEDLPRDIVHNAALLHHARRAADPSHDLIIRKLIASPGRATIGELVASSGLGGAGFRAVVRLIAAGAIQIVGNARIGYEAPVMWSGASTVEAA
ncbi:hypothetical protein HB375_12125 [Microvirga sp. c23x22]|uniref:TnsA endonuclease N-terminal domain-containing protein n=2 Tax=Microvirga terricola TaxID=2719797 RepID=A0ABX0VBX9_9HYPH|nr:hypothetical protein [Microvirga terricola]